MHKHFALVDSDMKFIIIIGSIILSITAFSKIIFHKPNQEIYMITTALNVKMRQGEIPLTSNSIPHSQDSQTSSNEMMDALVEYLFSLPLLHKVSSRNSFPSAVGAYIDESLPINSAVDREFIHIHRETGLGSMHAVFPEDVANEIISKKWGITHPMSKNWSHKKILMIYAPRHEEDLNEIKKIIKYAYDFSLAVE